MWKGRALEIFSEELRNQEWGTDYDPLVIRDGPNEEAGDLSWWRETDDGRGDTPRNRAYLKAYLRIGNEDSPIKVGDKLRAKGLSVKPGKVWMDRYVIGKMCARGFLEFQVKPVGMYEPAFELTEAGKNWIDQ